MGGHRAERGQSFSIGLGENRIGMAVNLDLRGMEIAGPADSCTWPFCTYNSSANIMSDPFIHIDDNWAALNPGYEVEVSPGFANVRRTVEQVPEPTTIALLGLGLAGLGFSRRKVKANNLI